MAFNILLSFQLLCPENLETGERLNEGFLIKENNFIPSCYNLCYRKMDLQGS